MHGEQADPVPPDVAAQALETLVLVRWSGSR